MKIELQKNTALKILSVFVAFLLWSYVITEQNPVVNHSFRVPVTITNLELLQKNELTMLEDYNSFYINVKLRGRRDVIDKIKTESLKAIADLRGHNSAGDTIIPVELSGVPRGVEVLSPLNPTITVTLESLITQKFPVNINVVGTPSEGAAALMAVADPQTVIVKGASSAVESVAQVAATVDITQQSKGVSKEVTLTAYTSLGKEVKNVSIYPNTVTAIIPIENTKAVPVEVDYKGELPDGYVMDRENFNPSQVYIVGKEADLAGIELIQTEKVDLTNRKSSFTKDVGLIVPDNVTLLKENEKITVNIVIAEEQEVEQPIEVTKLSLVNIPDGMEASVADDTYTVMVKGLNRYIQALGDINLYVDLKDATEGENTVKISYTDPANVKITSVTPNTVKVTLKPKKENE